MDVSTRFGRLAEGLIRNQLEDTYRVNHQFLRREPNVPPALAEALNIQRLQSVKHPRAQGCLPPVVQDYLRKQERDRSPKRIEFLKEKGGSSSSSLVCLVLAVEFEDQQWPKELIVQYSSEESLFDGTARCWYYPDDPHLPTLTRMVSSRSFLQDAVWESPWKRMFLPDEEISAKRLLYNPGRAATFLLSSPSGDRKLILKAVRPDMFAECLNKAQGLSQSQLHDRISFPRLISYSSREHVFLYEYAPGRRIDKLRLAGMSELRSALLDEVARTLQEIHRTTIPILPQWNPLREVARMRHLLRRLEISHPAIPFIIAPLLDQLSGRLTDGVDFHTKTIHNSFSPKHILYEAAGSPSLRLGRLTIIDWDSLVLGPPEKDLACFLSGFFQGSEEIQSFIRLYEWLANCKVNRGLLHGFFQYRRLLKICRSIPKDGDADERSINAVKEIADQLEHNPLME